MKRQRTEKHSRAPDALEALLMASHEERSSSRKERDGASHADVHRCRPQLSIACANETGNRLGTGNVASARDTAEAKDDATDALLDHNADVGGEMAKSVKRCTGVQSPAWKVLVHVVEGTPRLQGLPELPLTISPEGELSPIVFCKMLAGSKPREAVSGMASCSMCNDAARMLDEAVKAVHARLCSPNGSESTTQRSNSPSEVISDVATLIARVGMQRVHDVGGASLKPKSDDDGSAPSKVTITYSLALALLRAYNDGLRLASENSALQAQVAAEIERYAELSAVLAAAATADTSNN